MELQGFFATVCLAMLLLSASTGDAAQNPKPPKNSNDRIPVYVTAPASSNDSGFTEPGVKGIPDSVRDIQDRFKVVATKWTRLVTDPSSAVIVVTVTARSYDDGPEIMSVSTKVAVGDHVVQITGTGDPWKSAARSVVKQLDQWAEANYATLRERMVTAPQAK